MITAILQLVLFAYIGVAVDVGAAFWVVFGIYAVLKILLTVATLFVD